MGGHISNKVLRNMTTKIKLIVKIRKTWLKFLRHIMKKEGLVNMTFTVPTEGEKGQGRQRVTFLTNWCEWWFSKGRLDVTEGRKYGTPSKDRPQYSMVIDLSRQVC